MYILKNALRCISRSKGRNILIGLIVLVISVSACIGLSIRQAAEKAKTETLEDMNITATISFDRRSAMGDMAPPSEKGENTTPQSKGEKGGFDRSGFKEMMGDSSELSLEEYEKYATATTVKDFYYTASLSMNGSENLEPVTTEEGDEEDTTESSNSNQKNFGGNMQGGGRDRIKGSQSDFSLIGVSDKSAMANFQNGIAKIEEGSVFEEKTDEMHCIISQELALYNDIAVDDVITLTNPNNEDETYKLTVVGIFVDSTANESDSSFMGTTFDDPANKIYLSYAALEKIVTDSAKVSETVTEENGREYETALKESLSATYTFADIEGYNTFETEVYTLGLDESYTVSSSDITQFEQSLTPLVTLSKTASYFLIVILIIGAIILVVLNIFSVRERKYEIGVLTAMGMKKSKVALQFISEIFVVTMIAVTIGACVGAAASVPVANTLLQNQIESSQNRQSQIDNNFGLGGRESSNPAGGKNGGFMSKTADFVDEISSATNITVIIQMLGIAILLTLVAGAFSMLFIMRYEPLKILSNRD